MYETFTYDDQAVLPSNARDHWTFMETNSASAVMKAVCPNEWADIVSVLETYRLDPRFWLKAGGNRGDIAEQIDGEFSKRGWRETRLDLETRGLLFARDGGSLGELPIIRQAGYLVDNFKNRIVLDVEWNAKDGNLDRDLAAYRSWFDAGLISAGVIITKDRLALLTLARRIWEEYQMTLPEAERVRKLPIDLTTSTVTAFDKAQLRVRRGVMGACPILIIAANENTWNGLPYA
ncbi:BglII/BstYI family type II restriction endonuclease [Aestuariivirga sp. YIM B02566]|uniref:Restriction endonuclease n=1 Tax=Taklimakanibacter albus TaxID=2800327 RepID=A0ACC5RG28_9HYPH|nr:BglII/BstYI family type II restriction endonuclease [Aestuariivirga sp. YIM B02566]MBK1871476.1 restriction endonuclease [Aestuariivirga sp. YIM B02566]